jgi:hypothetical protein
MNDFDSTRRAFLVRAGLAGAGAALLLAGCGGGGAQEQAQAPAGQGGAPAAGAETGPCDDLSGLTAAQVQVRETFEYVEQAEDPELACRLCEFWTAPEAGRHCGGCTLFAGPVSPEGSCNSFSQA